MKKKFVIIDLEKQQTNKEYYFIGYYTSGNWGYFNAAKRFDTKQEAEWKAEEIVKEYDLTLTVIPIYSNY